MDAQYQLQPIVASVLEPLGYQVLEVVLKTRNSTTTLLIRLERQDEKPITLVDLEQANRTLGAHFDIHDPIAGEYKLQVESPGSERPLFTPRHFERFVGLRAKFRGDTGTFYAKIISNTDSTLEVKLEDGSNTHLAIGSFRCWLAEWPQTPR